MTPTPSNKKLFLSAVTSELYSYRELLASDMTRPNLDIAVQEAFGVLGSATLTKLDRYIRQCDGVIHLVGKATGEVPEEPEVLELLKEYPDFFVRLPSLRNQLEEAPGSAAMDDFSGSGVATEPQVRVRAMPEFSYTQWEAYLALYHRKPLFVYITSDLEMAELKVPRDSRFVYRAREERSQREHFRRICDLGHDRGQFLNEERLSSAVLRDLVDILPRLEQNIDVAPTRLLHTAERLIGRERELTLLDAAWGNLQTNVVIVRAWGGMGKTSLVATWMSELALKNWRGAEHVFDWSFYSQGTRDQGDVSSDTFFDKAFEVFGNTYPLPTSPWDRGALLARLIGGRRNLLVLDGLEPLQHAPGTLQGQLKDTAICALLKGLAARNVGLCIITTRESIDDLKHYFSKTVSDVPLDSLSDAAGASVLHHAGATFAGAKLISEGDDELRRASKEVNGHSLTLQLLGKYLKLAEQGDILKRDTVRLADASKEYLSDRNRPYGHAFKAMEAYEHWFWTSRDSGPKLLSALRIVSLFDRPAAPDLIALLRAKPAIRHLNDAVVGLSEREWRIVIGRLKEIGLVITEDTGALHCHPLLREYFAMSLRTKHLIAWRAGHRRLFEHLCTMASSLSTAPSLQELQPLYQAIVHGCHAGLHEQACADVYQGRIQQGGKHYARNTLHAISSDLAAIACFFDIPWSKPSGLLSPAAQVWLLSEAGITLAVLGRSSEAVEPTRLNLQLRLKRREYYYVPSSASNLSVTLLRTGDINGAIKSAELAVTYSDHILNLSSQTRASKRGISHVLEYWEARIQTRIDLGNALQKAGLFERAEKIFHQAESIQAENWPEYPLLDDNCYCKVLLASREREAWLIFLTEQNGATQRTHPDPSRETKSLSAAVWDRLSQSRRRNCKMRGDVAGELSWRGELLSTLGILDHLQTGSGLEEAFQLINEKVTFLRSEDAWASLPSPLLVRAWIRFLSGLKRGLGGAQEDLDEALEIAERGPMPLLMADIHLYRARLFFHETAYPWDTFPMGHARAGEKRGPVDDLAEARRLIEKHGYGCRSGELKDAETAILSNQHTKVSRRPHNSSAFVMIRSKDH